MASDTPFTETEALLALLRGQPEVLERIITDMLPFERRALAEAADQLADACRLANYAEGIRNG